MLSDNGGAVRIKPPPSPAVRKHEYPERHKAGRRKPAVPSRRKKHSHPPIPKQHSSYGKSILLIVLMLAAGIGIYVYIINSGRNTRDTAERKLLEIKTGENSGPPETTAETSDDASEKITPPKPGFKKSLPRNPVEKYGQLSTKGACIVDEDGNPVVLRGMSFFHCADADKFKNKECIKWLMKDWNCKIVRFPVMPDVRYERNPEQMTKMTFKFIDACIELGVYVIIDFHGGKSPAPHLASGIKFFADVAAKYGHLPNIIYEPYNEPYGKGVSWTGVVKPYHEAVIAAIRKYDKSNLILLGTPSFSLNIDEILQSPVSKFKNIVYVAHFYAATHKQDIRNRIQKVIDANCPVFISEFGTCTYTGDGKLDSDSLAEWMAFLDRNKIGWCNWSVHDKKETASILKPGANSTGSWGIGTLSPSGFLIRKYLWKAGK